ncbi:MAG: hypothetical protein V9G20_32290 [Candidatus Promineifilaceae bacterium]
MEENRLGEALAWAERQDILERLEERWRFYVPLLRRWLLVKAMGN